MTLPTCFIPDAPTRSILERVRSGRNVSSDEGAPLTKVGLIVACYDDIGNSWYELTNDGAEALRRW